jgi:YD repeat-containing protein
MQVAEPNEGGAVATLPDGETRWWRVGASGYRLFRRGFVSVFRDLGLGTAVLEEIRTPDGFSLRFEHDDEGRLLRVWLPLASRALRCVYEPRSSRLTGLVVEPGQTWLVRYEHDVAGRLARARFPTGRVDGYEYDGKGRLVRRWRRAEGHDARPSSRRYVYQDAIDSRICRASVDGETGRRIEVHVAEQVGRTVLIDASGAASSLTFDPARRPTRFVDASGRSVRLEIDEGLGRLVAWVDRLERRSEWLYDSDGLAAMKTEPDGCTVYVDHDRDGRPSVARDARGAARRWGWGERCELTVEVTPVGASHLYEYGDDGLLQSIRTPGELSFGMRFDRAAHVLAVRTPLGTRTAELDPLGCVARVTDEDGRALELGYDALGRLVGLAWSDALRLVLSRSDDGALTDSPSTVRRWRSSETRTIG